MEKQKSLNIDSKLHKELKQKALDQDSSLHKLVTDILTKDLKEDKKIE